MERTEITFGEELRADRFAALWRRDDGSLLLMYQEMAGGEIPVRFKGETSCHVMLASTDEGRTWREEKRVFPWRRGRPGEPSASENASAGRAASPGDFCRLTRLPDGRALMNGQAPGGGFFAISRDDFRDEQDRWEIIRPRHDQPITQMHHLRILPDGTWAMVGTWEEGTEGFQDERRHRKRARLVFLVSSDEGRTWTARSTLYDGKFFPFLLCEPSWVIGPEGHFRVFTREDMGYGPGVEFTSRDDGRTWQGKPMKFMGHHIYCENLPGGRGVLAVFRVCHYRSMPAVGAWWDDGSRWGRYLHVANINWGGRYFADVSQWVESTDGRFLVAYSLPPEAKYAQEVRVYVARFSLEEFESPSIPAADPGSDDPRRDDTGMKETI